jgi:hypothetical protein
LLTTSLKEYRKYLEKKSSQDGLRKVSKEGKDDPRHARGQEEE